jgi:S-adenosylmethionine/arginine decarboxylase-like enzyme
MSNYWGYHLMLDCSGCNLNISDKQYIYNFVKELVELIGMEAHGEPVIELLLQGEPNQGYSLMQLITTSNICAHFVDKDNTAYIDVFSCKEFKIDTVSDVVNKYFSPKKTKLNFITRHA